MKKSILYLIVFIFYQVAVAFILGVIVKIFDLENIIDKNIQLLINESISAFATLITFFWKKWCLVSRDYLRSKPYSVLFWTVLTALGIIIPEEWLLELFPESWMEDSMKEYFNIILRNPAGLLLIGFLAPLVEEVVFRGAILRKLLEWLSSNPNNLRPGMSYENDGNICLIPKARWIAICISALFFSLVHGNMAQIPGAFLGGLLLGWMYYRTGSIVPGILYHITNNTTACVIAGCFPLIPVDAKLSAYFGGNEHAVLMAVGFSLLIALPSLWQLHLLMKK